MVLILNAFSGFLFPLDFLSSFFRLRLAHTHKIIHFSSPLLLPLLSTCLLFSNLTWDRAMHRPVLSLPGTPFPSLIPSPFTFYMMKGRSEEIFE